MGALVEAVAAASATNVSLRNPIADRDLCGTLVTREALQSVPSDALTALDLDPPLLVMVLMQLAHESNAAHQDSSSTQRQRDSHQPEHGSN